ncbi:MAG TPA: TonB-dependent receptor, partial [Planctomycetota bacterium]|nr:TonB-dependent receptor [Planctomycetota bacterium]
AGIKEPSFLQSFGVSEFALGNPALLAERSRTYDVGVEQRGFSDRLRVEATVFHHDYRDQIAYTIVSFDPFRGTYENLGRTRGRGLELALDAAPSPRLRVGAQYTLLDGEILESASTSPLFAEGQPLLRRPKHQGSLWASANASRVSGGLNLLLVGSRSDSDFFGIGLTENEAYARLDARLRVSVAHGIEAFAVAENLLDREYQEILGYPALGRALRFGVRYRSREPRP